MASFGPLQSAGGVASSNFEFTHLSIHATVDDYKSAKSLKLEVPALSLP